MTAKGSDHFCDADVTYKRERKSSSVLKSIIVPDVIINFKGDEKYKKFYKSFLMLLLLKFLNEINEFTIRFRRNKILEILSERSIVLLHLARGKFTFFSMEVDNFINAL